MVGCGDELKGRTTMGYAESDCSLGFFSLTFLVSPFLVISVSAWGLSRAVADLCWEVSTGCIGEPVDMWLARKREREGGGRYRMGVW